MHDPVPAITAEKGEKWLSMPFLKKIAQAIVFMDNGFVLFSKEAFKLGDGKQTAIMVRK